VSYLLQLTYPHGYRHTLTFPSALERALFLIALSAQPVVPVVEDVPAA
jgi:hypothetical protein